MVLEGRPKVNYEDLDNYQAFWIIEKELERHPSPIVHAAVRRIRIAIGLPHSPASEAAKPPTAADDTDPKSSPPASERDLPDFRGRDVIEPETPNTINPDETPDPDIEKDAGGD